MTLRAIWAQSRGGVIGVGGELPWRLPEDLDYFKRATTGAAVVMGRKTWESFPDRFRPLPDRKNIVLTRDRSFGAGGSADGAVVVHTLDDALDEAGPDAWIIGGGELYALTMPMLSELWITEVDLDVDGDAFAPRLTAEWHDVDTETAVWQTSRTGLRYRFRVFRR